ncbi:MAG: hypothetical protein AVDCRST_MAG55-2861 [uncultured Rubrobacteraceae bacterium]|uniref:Uncharacterized protein n=1 Tax=uncultured Rubrobacteraceae bacterium TaxID=349277 RepID=A0A6J4QC58_9ACTN|nr:MAG: hypothetical protein AVDCRST_MAG55-2861 [uncultured Rubrobacteraceae bacterium]
MGSRAPPRGRGGAGGRAPYPPGRFATVDRLPPRGLGP